MSNCNRRLMNAIYVEPLAASVEEYLDAIMWHPFHMFYTIVKSFCFSQYVCMQCLNYYLFKTFVCTLRELVACLKFCSAESFNLVAVVVTMLSIFFCQMKMMVRETFTQTQCLKRWVYLFEGDKMPEDLLLSWLLG
ncbi:hypothetical protein BS78_04G219000 [Paspalum vaginatum]|nr:hypothetical protein BS78_04G219000 [Paspalum vaginatum]